MHQFYAEPNPSRSLETTEVRVLPTSVNLNNLLSYQDVMSAIEREFHLHQGQEREIIMKLWLKGQSMISILQRYRHLLQDLHLDDQDFLGGLKNIRDMVNFATRDVHNLREHTAMLQSQNQFLEQEFQRQIDRLTREKNDHIARLTKIIEQTCSKLPNKIDPLTDQRKNSSSQEELLNKFMQQNVDLQHEVETLRVKLEYTFRLVDEKLEQNKSGSLLQMALERIHQTEGKLQEIQWKSLSQREENELLKYLIDKSQNTTNLEQTGLIRTLEQRSLEREIDRVRHELELTEKRTEELKKRFDNVDETIQFQLEQLKITCDVLRDHINTCHQRLDELNQQPKMDNQMNQNQNEQLENELSKTRERNNELIEHCKTLKNELNQIQRQRHERENIETNVNKHENDLKLIQSKYNEAQIRLEHLQTLLDQSTRRCEQLEKEKLRKKLSDIHRKSDSLSQNFTNVTTKYRSKVNSMKARLEQTDHQCREYQTRSDYLQNQLERLEKELSNKVELLFEKEKLVQDVQYHQREILLEKQSLDERRSSDMKQLNELTSRNRFLEEELERLQRAQNLDNQPHRKRDLLQIETNNRLEEMKLKIADLEQRLHEERSSRDSVRIQMKILEEENLDLREIMTQMRKRAQFTQRDDRDRNDEIQQLIARAETHARQYMTQFNFTHLISPSTLVKLTPIS